MKDIKQTEELKMIVSLTEKQITTISTALKDHQNRCRYADPDTVEDGYIYSITVILMKLNNWKRRK